MVFITYNDLINDIRANFHKIRNLEKDGQFCGVLGVPRSGMIPALIIGEKLNIGTASIYEFIEHGTDCFTHHGNRKLNSIVCEKKRILVVEDTCYSGRSLKKTSDSLQKFSDQYEFVFMCVYMEGSGKFFIPDLYFVDIRSKIKNQKLDIALYEWNIMNHHVSNKMVFDIDGVIFVDPPDERNTEQYVNYINNPIPLFVPATSAQLTLCTYRMRKYYEETVKSLEKVGIKNPIVHMYNCTKYEDRTTPSYLFKSYVYSEVEKDKVLFVESEDFQAQKIHEITGKAVYCPTTNKMYS